MNAITPPVSPDGYWYWDGTAWRSLLSADGTKLWTGSSWAPRPASQPAAEARGRSGSRKGLILAAAGVGGAMGLLAMLSIVVLVASTIVARPTIAASTPLPCQSAEQFADHYHVHLSVLNNGRPAAVPARIGIEATCIHWLHTHDQSGLIHVEIPDSQTEHTFLLGDFFAVWGQTLSRTHAGPWKGGVTIWVQTAGEAGPHLWEGTPAGVPLNDCDAIFVKIGSSGPSPSAYQFPADFGCNSSRPSAVL